MKAVSLWINKKSLPPMRKPFKACPITAALNVLVLNRLQKDPLSLLSFSVLPQFHIKQHECLRKKKTLKPRGSQICKYTLIFNRVRHCHNPIDGAASGAVFQPPTADCTHPGHHFRDQQLRLTAGHMLSSFPRRKLRKRLSAPQSYTLNPSFITVIFSF